MYHIGIISVKLTSLPEDVKKTNALLSILSVKAFVKNWCKYSTKFKGSAKSHTEKGLIPLESYGVQIHLSSASSLDLTGCYSVAKNPTEKYGEGGREYAEVTNYLIVGTTTITRFVHLLTQILASPISANVLAHTSATFEKLSVSVIVLILSLVIVLMIVGFRVLRF